MTHPVKGGGKKRPAFPACGLERNEQQSEKAAETPLPLFFIILSARNVRRAREQEHYKTFFLCHRQSEQKRQRRVFKEQG